MQGNLGLKLKNSQKLPDIHARFQCNANEQSKPWKGLLASIFFSPRRNQFLHNTQAFFVEKLYSIQSEILFDKIMYYPVLILLF